MSGDLARYRKAYPRLFRHPGFKGLTPLGKLLVMYLLFGPQTNRLGLYFFSVHTAAEDLDTTAETLRKAMADVASTFGWHYDAVARVVYIPTHWKWNPPENVNVMRGALKDLAEVPPCGLVDAFADNLDHLSAEPGKDGANVRRTFLEGLTQRLPKGQRTQEQYQNPSQKQKQEPRAEARTDGRERDADASNKLYDVRLMSIAKETLGFLDRNADEETRVSTFYQVARSRQYSPEPRRADVLDVLNVAQRVSA